MNCRKLEGRTFCGQQTNSWESLARTLPPRRGVPLQSRIHQIPTWQSGFRCFIWLRQFRLLSDITYRATLHVPRLLAARNSFLRGSCQNQGSQQGKLKLMPKHGKTTMEVRPQQGQIRCINQPQQRGSESADIILITMPRGIIKHHIQTHPSGDRLALFIHNWEILTKETWVLTTMRGYHLPLCQWPTQAAVPVTFTLD